MLFHDIHLDQINYPDYPKMTFDYLIGKENTLTETRYDGEKSFDTLEKAIETLQEWACSHGVTIRKGSGNNKLTKSGEKRKVVLVCQCSGKSKAVSRERKNRVIKTECPFRINLNYRDKQDAWCITKMNLVHNHPLSPFVVSPSLSHTEEKAIKTPKNPFGETQ